MWALMISWLTPTSLFVFLNIMIGTIALTSRFTSHNKTQRQQEQHETQHHLARAPSFLDRVRSINLSLYKYPPPDSEPVLDTTTATDFGLLSSESEYATEQVDLPRLKRAPSLLERVKSIKFSSFHRSDPEPELAAETQSDSVPYPDTGRVSGSGEGHKVKRSKSEPRVELEGKGSEKMKKSASEKAVAVEDEEEREDEVERRSSGTTRLEKTVSFGDEGVDEKADDFINRFKQQLKLQRLDSLLRCREMFKGK